jgi:hypothetical protein
MGSSGHLNVLKKLFGRARLHIQKAHAFGSRKDLNVRDALPAFTSDGHIPHRG